MIQPQITVGITVYNAAETIEKAVFSAIKQDWDNTDIVIVDDASTDASPQMLEKLSKQFPVLRIFRQEENRGVAAARNRIIQEAQGEFLAFFDDDDESEPCRLKRQYQRIVEYEHRYADSAPVICYTARTQIYPDAERRYEPTMGTDETSIAPHGEAVAQRILTGKPVANVFGSTATCSQMARIPIYHMLGGFDECFRRSEDTDFNVRAALAGVHFAGIKEPLVTQTMTLAGDKRLAEERFYALRLLEKHKDFIRYKTSYSFCRNWLNAKYDFLEGKKLLFFAKLFKLFFQNPRETLERFVWAMPNTRFNVRLNRFHHEQK